MSENTSTGCPSKVAPQPRRRFHRSWFWLLGLCFGLVAHDAARAATTNAVTKPQPDRWLLVVDTSGNMERRTRALAGVIGEMLASGINGQLVDGAQIGVWTYGKELNAGVVPLQTWNPAQSNRIAGRTAQFFSTLKFQGKSKLNAAMPELNRVVKESRRLTVVIFSDGSQSMTNTPFDAAINEAYAKFLPTLKDTRMPLVTVLRSEKGKFIGQSVSVAPWPVEFPPFAPEPVKPVAPATKPKPKPEPAKSIVIGSSPKPTQPATNQMVLTPVPEVKPVTEIAPVNPPAPKLPEPPPPPAPVAPSASLAETTALAPAATVTSPVAVAVSEPIQPEASAPVIAPKAQPDATESGTILSRKWLLILGIGCMWVAIIMALLLVRRSRRSHGASLITQSFDRNQR
jgi:hypothetical protein